MQPGYRWLSERTRCRSMLLSSNETAERNRCYFWNRFVCFSAQILAPILVRWLVFASIHHAILWPVVLMVRFFLFVDCFFSNWIEISSSFACFSSMWHDQLSRLCVELWHASTVVYRLFITSTQCLSKMYVLVLVYWQFSLEYLFPTKTKKASTQCFPMSNNASAPLTMPL